MECVTFACNTGLDKLVNIFLPIGLVTFLNTNIIHNPPIIILNLWSVVHVVAGIIFYLVWKKYSSNIINGFIVWTLINIAFEGFEFYFASQGLYKSLFFEEFTDIVWDFIANSVGYYIGFKMVWRHK